jgi:DNA-binding NtrC family response regulator
VFECGVLRVYWAGDPPNAALHRELRAAGLSVSHDAKLGCEARVIATGARSGVPEVPAGPPWIWACAGDLEQAAAEVAAARGAYDSLSLKTKGAAGRLVSRLLELGEMEPVIPEAPTFVAVSSAGRRVLARLLRAAQTSMPVLLTGETGTGKEVAARLLHEWSARRANRFVPINCAAIPDDLMEAELFGYARGAFSGAVQRYDGQLMAAQGGTVLLDEIDDTPPPIQAKLLRVLEDKVVSRLGENEWHKVDFRLVAATNRDLRALIASGHFGADLFERFAILSIEIPPLRQRLEDLPALASHFIARYHDEEPEARSRAGGVTITPEAMAALSAYPWPGNIRELRNVLFEAMVDKRAGSELLLSDLPRRVLVRTEPVRVARAGAPAEPRSEPRPPSGSLIDEAAIEARIADGSMNLRREVEELERLALKAALRRADGSPATAARLLGEVGRGTSNDPGGTVRAMIRRLGLG